MPMPWEMDWGSAPAAPAVIPAAPGAKPWEMDWGGEPTFAQRAEGAFDRSTYRPTTAGSLTQMREIPEPDRSKQSIPEMMRNVSQRARNTAFGAGPGSVGGIPGVAALTPFAAQGAGAVAQGAGTLAKGAGETIFGGEHANAAQWLARLIAGGGGEEVVKAMIKHLTASLTPEK